MVEIKKALKVELQVEYLEQYKNIDFTNFGKTKAAEYLKYNNYINVITPFKYYYAKRDPLKDYELLKTKKNEDGVDIYRHVYENKTLFEEYVKRYEDERKNYDIIYKNIIIFKSTLKNLLAYHLLTSIDYESKEELSEYISSLSLNIVNLKMKEETKNIVLKNIEKISNKIKFSYNIFHTMYSLNFRLIIDLFNVLNEKTKDLIFEDLEKKSLVFGTSNASQLHKTMIKIKDIRNAVMHNDSIEVVVRYVNANNEKNNYRKPGPRKAYRRLIKKLEKIN